MLEFLNAYRKAKFPPGSRTLAKAWAPAQKATPPPEAMQFQNPELRLLVSLCRELQLEAGERPFYLASRTARKLLGHESHSTAALWLGAPVGLDILRIVEPGRMNRATRYFYLPLKR
jgi:hypothetical protein